MALERFLHNKIQRVIEGKAHSLCCYEDFTYARPARRLDRKIPMLKFLKVYLSRPIVLWVLFLFLLFLIISNFSIAFP